MLTLSKNTVHPDRSASVPSNRTPTLPSLRHPPCYSHSPVPRRLRPDDVSILFQHLPRPAPRRHTPPAGSRFHRLNKRFPSCPIRQHSDLFPGTADQSFAPDKKPTAHLPQPSSFTYTILLCSPAVKNQEGTDLGWGMSESDLRTVQKLLAYLAGVEPARPKLRIGAGGQPSDQNFR